MNKKKMIGRTTLGKILFITKNEAMNKSEPMKEMTPGDCLSIWHDASNSHIFENPTIIKEPTCTENGSQRYICKCGKVKEVSDIIPLGHEYDENFSIDKEAYYKYPGIKSRHCLRCDERIDITEIPAPVPGGYPTFNSSDYNHSIYKKANPPYILLYFPKNEINLNLYGNYDIDGDPFVAYVSVSFFSDNSINDTIVINNDIGFDPKNIQYITNLNKLFGENKKLKSIKGFEHINFDGIQNLIYTFKGTGLESFSLVDYNFASSIISIENMFDSCTMLKSITLGNINLGNITSLPYLFYNCTNLTEVNIYNVDTSKVTNMNSMFGKCKSITSLDLRSFDTHNVTSMHMMFAGCTNLTEILVSRDKWIIPSGTNGMFNGCGVDHVTYVD